MRVERAFLQSKVARRVFLLFVVCALGPLCTLAAFSYAQVRAHLVDQADEYLRKECRLAGQSLVDHIEHLDADLRSLALLVETPASWLDEPRLDALRTRFARIAVTGPNGSVALLGDADGAQVALGPAERAHLERGGTLVRAAAPATAPRVLVVRSLAGGRVLVGEARADALGAAVDTDTTLCLLDETGRVLVSTDSAEFADAARAAQGRRPTGTFAWSVDADEHRAAFKSLFMVPTWHMDWTVACSLPEERILEPVRAFGRHFLLITTLSLWIVLLLSLAQIRRTLVPIAELRDATHALTDDLETRVRIESGDELQELGESFNRMAESIQTRTNELEAANRAKAEFLANMSHELRTPMTAVLGFAEICMDTEMEESDRQEHLEIVCRNGKHLLRVINDILDLSKIEAERLELELVACAPSELVDDAVALLAASAADKGLALDVAIDPAVPPLVVTDPTRLHQVLMNLLGNAIKFTVEGGVRLEVVRAGDDSLAFTVTDTGIGMSPEVRDRAFSPFAQADTSLTRQVGGTGLGLSISRSLARLLGGDLVCTSAEGAGSAFTLTVAAPTVPAAPAPRAEAAAPLPAGARAAAAGAQPRA